MGSLDFASIAREYELEIERLRRSFLPFWLSQFIKRLFGQPLAPKLYSVFKHYGEIFPNE